MFTEDRVFSGLTDAEFFGPPGFHFTWVEKHTHGEALLLVSETFYNMQWLGFRTAFVSTEGNADPGTKTSQTT